MKLIFNLTIVLLGGGGADTDAYIDHMENGEKTSFGDILWMVFFFFAIFIILSLVGKFLDKK